MTGDYRRDLHAGFATPEMVVFGLVARATGLRPAAREQLVRGYDNEVYRVATRQGPRYIVRIKRRGGVPFQSEAWALAQCRARDVPVPEVLALDSIAVDGQRHEAMVQTELSGVPFSDLRAMLNDAEQARVLEQAGMTLRRIHRVPAGGFYRPNDAGGWDIKTWERIAALAYRDRVAEREEILRAGFSDDEFAQMREALCRVQRLFAGGRPVLCHGDYLPGHWLVGESLTLSGVIDFGEWQGGLPIHDFADLHFMEPALDLAPFLCGYGDADFLNGDFPARCRLYQVGLMMGYLAHYVRIGNAGEARFTAARLRAVLAALAYS